MSKWGDLQFFHEQTGIRGRRYTVAVGVPPSNDLLRIILQTFNGMTPDTLDLRVGSAIVSPTDRYEKEIGRNLAAVRLVPKEFKLLYCNLFAPGKAELILKAETGLMIRITTLTDRECVPQLKEVWGVLLDWSKKANE